MLRPSVKIDYRRLENFVKGKSVVVTGAANGLGRAVVDQLIANGSRILAVDKDGKALGRLRDEPGVTTLHLDVASPGAAQKIAS